MDTKSALTWYILNILNVLQNNKGHIYSEFLDTAEVQNCLWWLRRILDVAWHHDSSLLDGPLLTFRMTVVLHHDTAGLLSTAPAA